MTELHLGFQDLVGPIQSTPHRDTLRRWAGVLALLPTVALFGFTIGTNTPLGLRLPLHAIGAPIEVAAVAGPAVAALLLGYATSSESVRVALFAAGVFGGLTLLSSTATGPAIVALGVAGVLVAVAHRPRSTDRPSLLQFGVTLAFVIGIVTSLAASTGFEPAITRRLGSASIALAIAGTPAYTGISPRSLAVGVLAGAAVLAAGLLAPVLTAAISLLGLGLLDLPLLLLAIGAVGGATAVAAGLAGRTLLAGAGLTALAAGVPTTVPAAIAVLVALVLFADGTARSGVIE